MTASGLAAATQMRMRKPKIPLQGFMSMPFQLQQLQFTPPGTGPQYSRLQTPMLEKTRIKPIFKKHLFEGNKINAQYDNECNGQDQRY